MQPTHVCATRRSLTSPDHRKNLTAGYGESVDATFLVLLAIAVAKGEPGMSKVPTGTELARPFMPAKDFDLSKRFYEALGFEKVLDSEVAIFNAGSGGFILQRYFQEEWANNSMMQLMVDDLDVWWAHIQSLDLAKNFGVLAPKAPAMQPWGLRIAYVVDPSGVLWHIAQRRENMIQDT
jgi:hypothetical protein